jgi:hypothetical protein
VEWRAHVKTTGGRPNASRLGYDGEPASVFATNWTALASASLTPRGWGSEVYVARFALKCAR